MADSFHKKARKSNFSADEVDVLVGSVRNHFEVLYGRFAKRATNRWVRQRAWLDILRKVNGVSIEKRTLQEVKNKWKKCQYALKEKGVFRPYKDDDDDSPWEDVDSMPLQERLSKGPSSEKAVPNPVLKSQQMSPTKLKVTRQSARILNKPQVVEQPPPSPVNEEMCLRWNSHHSNMQTAFPSILHKEQYVDVTLAAEGKTLKCHRLILSSCSPYFEEILSAISPFQHPVLFMKDIPFWILKSLCDFMYAGEVHVYQNKLEELLSVAEALKIKGLAGKSTPPEDKEKDREDSSSKAKNSSAAATSSGKTVDNNKHPVHHQKNKLLIEHNSYGPQDDEDGDLLDPLDLLEPLYEEAAEEKKPSSTIVRPKELKFHYQPFQPMKKKLRKRKYSEPRDPSPPPVFSFRKGTRSRPNIKLPKYYHSDYNPPKAAPNSSQPDPLLEMDEIKTEPIDVEDNLINYSDDESQYSMELQENPSPIVITNAKPPQLEIQPSDKFKRIKLTKPVISDIHTIAETGGLEVIKIDMQPTGDVTNGTEPRQKSTETVEPEVAANANNNASEPEVVAADVDIIEDGESQGHLDNNLEPDSQDQADEVTEETVDSHPKQTDEELIRNSSLGLLEKEAMNVANAITLENQTSEEAVE